uniref:VASt domain-containing protein n=1 Tax=Macrostomum lignano TaxID=282301 RepID=A0A1I8FMC4_9PLAT
TASCRMPASRPASSPTATGPARDGQAHLQQQFQRDAEVSLASAYGVVPGYDVIQPARTVRNHPVQFPSFTVCNSAALLPGGHPVHPDRGLVLPKNYSQFVMQAMRNTAENQRGRRVQRHHQGRRSATSSRPRATSSRERAQGLEFARFARLGHTIDQTILICETTILDKDFKRSKFCETIGTWTRTYDNKFLNCYTFTADANNTQKILTVRIMAYTNERKPHKLSGLQQLPGHAGGGTQHPARQHLTEIRFETKEWVMKEPPHGRCSTRVPPSVLFNGDALHLQLPGLQEEAATRGDHEEVRLPGQHDPAAGQHAEHRPGLLRPHPAQPVLSGERVHPAAHNHSTPHDDNDDQRKRPSFHFDADFNDFLRRLTCNTAVFKVSGHAHRAPVLHALHLYTYLQTTPPSAHQLANQGLSLRDRQRLQEPPRPHRQSAHRRGKISRNSSYLDPVFQRLQRIYGPLSEADSPAEAERMLRGNRLHRAELHRDPHQPGQVQLRYRGIEEKAVISLTSACLLSIWVGLTSFCIVEIVDLLYNICVSYNGRRPEHPYCYVVEHQFQFSSKAARNSRTRWLRGPEFADPWSMVQLQAAGVAHLQLMLTEPVLGSQSSRTSNP